MELDVANEKEDYGSLYILQNCQGRDPRKKSL